MNSFETARSNGFRVRDTEAFLAWANDLGLEVVGSTQLNGIKRFAIFPGDGNEGSFPSHRVDPRTDEEEPIDLQLELSRHLSEGQTAVLMGCRGDQKELHGWAVAITWDGRRTQMCLSDIYSQAILEIGVNPAGMNYCEGDGSEPYFRQKP